MWKSILKYYGTFRELKGHIYEKNIFLKTIGIVSVLLIVRFLIDLFNIDILPEVTLIGAFVGGTIFILAIIMSGVLADFKESEKIADDLPVAITNLFLYIKYIKNIDDEMETVMQAHVKGLLSGINGNIKRNEWNREDMHSKIYTIVKDLRLLKENDVEVSFIITLQNEVMNIMKMLNRIETIVKTTFPPAAYLASYISIGISILLLLFARIDSIYEAQILVGSISFVLVILILLILDIENPFEVGKNTEADVNLSHLFDLEEHLEEIEAAYFGPDKGG